MGISDGKSRVPRGHVQRGNHGQLLRCGKRVRREFPPAQARFQLTVRETEQTAQNQVSAENTFINIGPVKFQTVAPINRD